ncbi:hypothetical protein [Malikia granosa]|uniref:YbjN domain-containing protein n=1 Tax=Malikia granosa TaxID=263067 RepID=A0A2S9K056_9BURK|nr:hypothetical protein [Malikia granosa]PRD63829.1 hypothetical protein C6P64_17645 [Malikia granosa]
MSLNTIIEEENVNLATLSVELERATIANEPQGNKSLYVGEPGMFPFWIEIHEGIRFILLHSYLEFMPECEHADRLELCERINQKLYLPAFHVRSVQREGEPDSFRLVGNYPLYYRDGLFSSHFIRLCRLFSDGMKRVEAEFDPEHQLLQKL